MIRLDIEDYCQQCLDFNPDVLKPEREISKTLNGTHSASYSDTIVRCKYRKRCDGIKRFLEQQAKGDINK